MTSPNHRVTKTEVQATARFCAIASTDKLIEALGYPLINNAEREVIEAELRRRVDARRNNPDAIG